MTRCAVLVVLGSLVAACNGTTTDTGVDTDPVGGSSRIDDILALSPDLVNGETVFNTWCTACHGADGAGLAGFGGDLRGWDPVLTVTNFFPPPEGTKPATMTDFTGILSDQEMADVAGYIGTLPPAA